MDKTDKLLEEKFVICHFSFSTFPKYKVRVKEIITKHNKEIDWNLSEENIKSDEGEKMISFRLKGNVALTEIPELREMLVGLIEDIYHSLGVGMTEESAEAYNKIFIGIAYGKEFTDAFDIKLDPKKVYFYLQYMDSRFFMFSDVNNIIEIEKKYPKVVEKSYGETVQSWYERNVEVIKKTFVSKGDLETAKAIVEMLEKDSNIKRIPYKLKKFRFAT